MLCMGSAFLFSYTGRQQWLLFLQVKQKQIKCKKPSNSEKKCFAYHIGKD